MNPNGSSSGHPSQPTGPRRFLVQQQQSRPGHTPQGNRFSRIRGRPGGAVAPAPQLGSATAGAYHVVTVTSVVLASGSDDGSSSGTDLSSVLSEFDLVNDTIQEYLLASDNSDGDGDGDGLDFDSTAGTVYLSALLPRGAASAAGDAARRRRMAKKAASSTALSSMSVRSRTGLSSQPKMRGSLSAGALFALDAAVDHMADDSHRRGKKGQSLVRVPHTGSATPTPGARGQAALLTPLKPMLRGAPVGPLSVVLDIDETLVYARDGPVFVRPHLRAFLDACEELRCEIIVWTAGSASYVNPILHAIADSCRRGTWFHQIISRHRRWFREDCDREGNGVKDLQLLGRPLDRVVLIENNPVSVMRQPASSILVEDYLRPNDADDALLAVCAVLRRAVRSMGGGAGTSPGLLPTAVGPMLTPGIPLSQALDADDTLGYADFSLDFLAAPARVADHSGDEELPRRSGSSARFYGPQQLPHSSSRPSRHGDEEEEEEESLAVVVAYGPFSAPCATRTPLQPRTVRCRVLRHSSTEPFLAARSYGCLNPILQ